MSNRTRKNWVVYKTFTKQARSRDCDFCQFNRSQKHFVKEYKHFWVVKNLFPFDIWDTTGVKDHLMLVPKRHVDSIGHFNKAEQVEFTPIIGEYDLKGYSVYGRPQGSMNKSVAHQHTHLIAADNKRKKLLLYLGKPHILLHK